MRYLYKNGGAVRSRVVTLKYINNPHRSTSRVAVVISKKVLKSAVRRNRVRRRIYEIVRNELPHLQAPTDLVLLVFAGEVLTMPQDELESTIKHLLSSADLYKSTS